MPSLKQFASSATHMPRKKGRKVISKSGLLCTTVRLLKEEGFNFKLMVCTVRLDSQATKRQLLATETQQLCVSRNNR